MGKMAHVMNNDSLSKYQVPLRVTAPNCSDMTNLRQWKSNANSYSLLSNIRHKSAQDGLICVEFSTGLHRGLRRIFSIVWIHFRSWTFQSKIGRSGTNSWEHNRTFHESHKQVSRNSRLETRIKTYQNGIQKVICATLDFVVYIQVWLYRCHLRFRPKKLPLRFPPP